MAGLAQDGDESAALMSDRISRLKRKGADESRDTERGYFTFEPARVKNLRESAGRHFSRSWSKSSSDFQSLPAFSAQPTVERTYGSPDDKIPSNEPRKHRNGNSSRPLGGSANLGTYAGVFVPTTLNVLSILMFLRFGFILGQSGVLGMLGMLIVCYLINLVTTLSISAIATNGTVRGGGAYYLISRSLGPEFGGSIGIVLYLGFVFNTGLNAVGLIDSFILDFGNHSGNWDQFLPEGYWWQYLWSTIILIFCTGICLAGSGLFARCSNGLLVILLVATFSIPLSTLVVAPFRNPQLKIDYTGLSLSTLKSNLMPHFTKGADGSQTLKRESFQNLFGILFPATGGIFAGASMSGDLRNPSRAIPRGTLHGLALTFFTYLLVILAMAASIPRTTLYSNVNVIQDVNMSRALVLLGEFATSFFSALMGVIGSAKLLQALARDDLIPGLSIFGQGTKSRDEPTYAILITYTVAQITMLFDINRIASFITMTYLLTFLVTNLACFLLKVSSAPNFRPSFHYFSSWTAALGAIVSGITMFFVDSLSATLSVTILAAIFLIIHYTTPPKSWGDVSQSLIYHQVRKYLLRLRQEHVKFWRPQILLFVNDPRRSYKLIQFCNSLKKGALFILGHVIVTQDFGTAVPEAKKQQAAWAKYIDFSKIKAFVNVAISPGVEWGARNIVLSCGLGGMRPNIVVMGFYNLNEYRLSRPVTELPPLVQSRPSTPPGSFKRRRRVSRDDRMRGQLPTDTNRQETAVSAKHYVTILEDFILRLQVNVAIAKGFNELELPVPEGSRMQKIFSFLHSDSRAHGGGNNKKYIDLWPIQMSATIMSEGAILEQNVLTTNFDTYTLILQLGCILNTVPAWKRVYSLRMNVFVEYESDVEEERERVEALLANLRIKAEVLVYYLASGSLQTYEIIVNGNYHGVNIEAQQFVDGSLQQEDWWQDIKAWREGTEVANDSGEPSADDLGDATSISGREILSLERFRQLGRRLRRKPRPTSIANFSRLGISLSMETSRLDPDMISNHPAQGSASTSEDDESDSDTLESTDGERSDSISILSDNDESRLASSNSSTQRRRSRAARPLALNISEAVLHEHPTATSPRETEQDDDSKALQPAADSLSDLPTTEAFTTRQLPLSRMKTQPTFSSNPVPRTTVASEDGPGPSIMFSTPSPPRRDGIQVPLHSQSTSIYEPRHRAARPASNTAASQSPPRPYSAASMPARRRSFSRSVSAASGASQPLSFNSVPCRAQHLILNELMRQHSGGNKNSNPTNVFDEDTVGETAVIFTTLPAPVEGTCDSEEDSLRYLADLETLCEGLPPVLMVHSNSMTVTMNL